MRKKFIPLICAVIVGMYSCSDLDLPERIEVQGSLNLPTRLGTSNWGIALAKTLNKIFDRETEGEEFVEGNRNMVKFSSKIYDVNSRGQTEQVFCVYAHTEMTNPLNPDEYLSEIADYLYRRDDDIEYEIYEEIDTSFLKKITLSMAKLTVPSLVSNFSISFLPSISIPLPNLSGDFLHAEIGEGNLEIEILIDGEKSANGVNYDITLTQAPQGVYGGLNCSLSPNPTGSLNNQHINNSSITIGGEISVGSLNGGETVEVQLKMNIDKITALDWDFSDIEADLEDSIAPLFLNPIVPYVNSISFGECNEEEVNPTTGIGLQFYFSEVMDNAFDLSIECGALHINNTKTIEKGKHITFGNNEDFTIPLEEDDEWDFKVSIQPKDGDNVLHITDITPGELKIEGKVWFFQNWTEAELNMKNIIKVSTNEGGTPGVGQFPSEKEKPIDLSAAKDYLEGFQFEDIKAELYLSGPNGVFENENEKPKLTFSAKYGEGEEVIMFDKDLELDDEVVSIEGDLDVNGSYTKNTLPAGGNEFSFLEIMNDQPENLVFHYSFNLEDMETLTVTSEMFDSAIAKSHITTVIMIMLPMKITAGAGGGTIKFPDMFEDENKEEGEEKDKKDLFGRDEPGGLFKGGNIDFKMTVEFIDTLFTNGNGFLYIGYSTDENDNALLFPQKGVTLNNSKILMDITGKEIRNNYPIVSDVKMEFEPGAKIVVPRKMGTASIKIEMKGNINLVELLD